MVTRMAILKRKIGMVVILSGLILGLWAVGILGGSWDGSYLARLQLACVRVLGSLKESLT